MQYMDEAWYKLLIYNLLRKASYEKPKSVERQHFKSAARRFYNEMKVKFE